LGAAADPRAAFWEGEVMKRLIGTIVLASGLMLAGAAHAGTMNGGPALSFAALVGQYSPTLTAARKHILNKFLSGQTSFSSSNATFSFKITEVHCQLGDVDLTKHSCQITYGAAVTTLKGEEGANILANMALAGVMGDGAAGTIHYDVKTVTCTIKVGEIKSPDGGGASCTFT
jgi:hypothetical protein